MSSVSGSRVAGPLHSGHDVWNHDAVHDSGVDAPCSVGGRTPAHPGWTESEARPLAATTAATTTPQACNSQRASKSYDGNAATAHTTSTTATATSADATAHTNDTANATRGSATTKATAPHTGHSCSSGAWRCELRVLWQHDGQILFRHGNDAARAAVNDGDGRTPVSLPRHEPVAELEHRVASRPLCVSTPSQQRQHEAATQHCSK